MPPKGKKYSLNKSDEVTLIEMMKNVCEMRENEIQKELSINAQFGDKRQINGQISLFNMEYDNYIPYMFTDESGNSFYTKEFYDFMYRPLVNLKNENASLKKHLFFELREIEDRVGEDDVRKFYNGKGKSIISKECSKYFLVDNDKASMYGKFKKYLSFGVDRLDF